MLLVKSTKPNAQTQPSSNCAFSHSVSSSPSLPYVFLPGLLVSCSVAQSVCSEVFISAAGPPGCRRDKWLFKFLRSSPSSSFPSPPKLLSLPPVGPIPHALPVLIPLPPLVSPLAIIKPFSPLLSSLPGDPGGLRSAEHHAAVIWSGTSQACQLVCVCECTIWLPQAAGARTEADNWRSGRPSKRSVKVSVTLRNMEPTAWLAQKTPLPAHYFRPDPEGLHLHFIVLNPLKILILALHLLLKSTSPARP